MRDSSSQRGEAPRNATAHTAAHNQGVSWYELFFDLVLVAWLMSANSVFSEAEDNIGALQGVLAVLVAYVVWTLNTTVISRFPGDTFVRRSLIVTQMLFLLISILAIDPYHGLPNRFGVVAIGVVFLAVAGMYLEVAASGRYGKAPWIPVWTAAAAALICFALAPLVNDVDTVLFITIPVVAAGLAILPTLLFYSPRVRREFPVNSEHLTERWGQLLIITLGEGFIFMVEVFWGRESIPRPVTFFIVFLTLFALWRFIFDSSTVEVPRSMPYPLGGLILGHLLLLLGIVGFINGVVEQGIAGEDEPFTYLQVGASLFLIFVALAWINLLRRGVFARVSKVELAMAMGFLLYGVLLAVTEAQPVASFVSTCSLVVLVASAVLSKFDPAIRKVPARL